jgi:hypothetical protein
LIAATRNFDGGSHTRRLDHIDNKQWFDSSPAIVIWRGQHIGARSRIQKDSEELNRGVPMLTGSTRRISLAILAAIVAAPAIAASTQAQAHSSSCTPAHLTSALKQVEAECGSAKVISAHRPGARIRGTSHISQHALCDGTHGAIDAVFSNRACALNALRKTNYTIITYGRSSPHIHIGTDTWRNGTQVARRSGVNARVAARQQGVSTRYAARQEQRMSTRYAARQRASVRYVARAQAAGEQNGWSEAAWSNGDAGWSNAGGAGASYAQRPARAATRQRGARVAARQSGGNRSGWNDGNWSGGDASWSYAGGAEGAYAQRAGGRVASRQRGVRVASRHGVRAQNGWGGNASGSNWSSDW